MFNIVSPADIWITDSYVRSFQVFDYARLGLEYIAGHLPQAIHVEKSLVWTEVRGVAGMIPEPMDLASALSSIGADRTRPALVYDGGNGLYASRLAWALTLAGWTDVSLLEGGLTGWRQAKLPVKIGAGTKHSVQGLDEQWQGQSYAKLSDVIQRSEDTVLLDTRTTGEFNGTDRRSKRAGRIPGAIHWEWNRGLAPNGLTFKTAEELRADFAKLGIGPHTHVITYCQSGVRAAHALYSLARAGITKIQNYDGSWEEWGNRNDLPLVLGAHQS